MLLMWKLLEYCILLTELHFELGPQNVHIFPRFSGSTFLAQYKKFCVIFLLSYQDAACSPMTNTLSKASFTGRWPKTMFYQLITNDNNKNDTYIKKLFHYDNKVDSCAYKIVYFGCALSNQASLCCPFFRVCLFSKIKVVRW